MATLPLPWILLPPSLVRLFPANTLKLLRTTNFFEVNQFIMICLDIYLLQTLFFVQKLLRSFKKVAGVVFKNFARALTDEARLCMKSITHRGKRSDFLAFTSILQLQIKKPHTSSKQWNFHRTAHAAALVGAVNLA